MAVTCVKCNSEMKLIDGDRDAKGTFECDGCGAIVEASKE